MSALTEVARATRLRQLFLQLHAIMAAERERNWIRGVSHIVAVLDEAESNPGVAADRISEAHRSYRSMNAGNGSFSDFHVWRENLEERQKASAELNRVTAAIWQEFESHE